MIKGLRRVLLMALLLMTLSITANAQVSSDYTVKELSVRLNHIGAKAFIEIKGTPGSLVSVELLTPGSNIAQTYTADNLKSILAGIDTLELSDSGRAVYNYTAETDTGLYTFRVSGEVDSVCYTTQNNEVTKAEPDVFFAEMWTVHDKSAYSEHMQGSVWLRGYMLQGNMEVYAKQIAQKVNLREPGRRYIYIDTDVMTVLSKDEEILWQPDRVTELYNTLDEFFGLYYEFGGELDGIYTDNENVMTTWAIKEENLDSITNDPLYTEKIRPQLVERGFNFERNTNRGKNELYDVSNGNYTTAANTKKGNANYLIWDAVVSNYKSECLTNSIYEAARKYYPEVYYANYQSSARIAATYNCAEHKYYLGGNRINAGTHSSPVLYRAAKNGSVISLPDGTRYTLEVGSPYLETRALANSMRGIMLATEGGKTMPWVVSSTYHTKDYYHIKNDVPYFYEYLFHVAMCNPDILLFYGPIYYSTDPIESVNGNIEGMRTALEEFNSYADKADAVTLVENLADTDGYILSGMYTNGRNLWRITPDNTMISIDDFLVDNEENPTFYVDGQTITFADGKILDNMYSEYGYWIETDADVYPEITYDVVPEGCTVTFKYYDKFGIELDEPVSSSDIYTVAVYYDGLLENVSTMTMNVANYDDSGLVSLKPLKTPIWSAVKGRLVSHNIKNIGKSKLLIWENLETLTPITPALPWVYAN